MEVGIRRPSCYPFACRFKKAGEKVRFAVTLPYVQQNLEAFLGQHAQNPHLTRTVLTNSLKGRPVDLLQIGEPAAGRKAVLLTARHHACETMASLVLEGFPTTRTSSFYWISTARPCGESPTR